jgi:hypothetical protein
MFSLPSGRLRIGLPLEEKSEATSMLRFVLHQLLTPCQSRDTIEIEPMRSWKIIPTINGYDAFPV